MPELPDFRRCKTAHLRFGRRGERLAERLLKERGLTILCRNYEGPRGEIDIVALDGAILCFVEVKARKPRQNSRPADAVTLRKRLKIVKTAAHYRHQLNNPPLPFRFDIIEVVMTRWRLLEIRHWPGEFTEEQVRRRIR